MTQQYLFQDYVEAWRARREQERDHDAPPRRWYRFTLWKMVVAFVLLGAAFAYLRNTHWGYIAGERISEIGRRFGLVERPDASKIRVSAVRPFGALDFEWRISIPQGFDYQVEVKYGNERYTRRFHGIPQESLISFTAEKQRTSEGTSYRVMDARSVIPRTMQSGWNWTGEMVDTTFAKKKITGVLWGDNEKEFTPGETIVLYRSEVTDEKGPWGIKYRRGPIVTVWLRPVGP